MSAAALRKSGKGIFAVGLPLSVSVLTRNCILAPGKSKVILSHSLKAYILYIHTYRVHQENM
jgi:hypothetical protein